MTRPVHLGLDVGGTASRWVACDAEGQVVARGQGPGATGHVFNPAERDRLCVALHAIGSDLSARDLQGVSLAAGMTGYGPAVADDARALIGTTLGLIPERIILMDDILLAFVASFGPGEGHLVSAGTGSIGLHVGESGEMVRVGGRGILIDDAGSGSWIALAALDRMYRVLDRDGSFAAVAGLAGQIFAMLGGQTWTDVKQFVYAGDRGRIGTLAVAVARAAEGGDPVALDILGQAGAELGALAQALLRRGGMRPVHFIGGVLRLHPLVSDRIRASLAGADVSFTEPDAALAAARLCSGGLPFWTAARPWSPPG